ncbi:unnamed protein product [Lactuca saligna]|uniref:Uncharacterized protein n=1 Tax=Lactuca saligna TaxID=75948 RepID=A0AA35YTT9_LACSI|nr:unnamed protein product [Lactuca saligna]
MRDMENIWDWVLHPYPEENQVVPSMPETESDYNLMMPLPPTSIAADAEPFKDEEEPNEEEQPSDEIDGLPIDNSPYLDSSSQ